MKLHEIQNHFKKFSFEWSENHPILSKNSKLLFNISGGVIFENIISNQFKPEHSRIASIQTCLRTDTWDKIGISGRHHLVFDMLGHFSFYEGSAYETKRLMIESAWIFLIDYTKLCPNDLLATIHPEDNLSKKIWDYFGVKTVSNQNNTTITPNKKLCGVRTEIIWINPKTKIPIELWNIVFTQFQGTKIFSNPMKKIAADSGISIDRITTAAEYCCNDYENSTWKSVIDRIARITNNSDMTKIYRLSDLGKAATLLIFQGLYPGKKLANYVLRKIIREACIICYELQLPFEEFSKISSERWIQKNADQELVISILMDEFLKFNKAIQKGKKEYKKLITKKNSAINELDIKYLNSTFGYPKIMLKKEELYEK